MIVLFILLSLCFLLISVFFAVWQRKILKNNKVINPMHIIFAGAFLAIFFIMFYIDWKPTVHGRLATPFLALFHSIQVMLAGYDFEFLYTRISSAAAHYRLIFGYVSVLFFLSPLCTFGFVLSFVENIGSYLMYWFKRKSDIYILSDLSEKSIILARSIREKFPAATLIFMNVFDDSNEKAFDLLKKAKKIKALHFKKDIVGSRLKFRKADAKATFFAINENESTNLDSALKLISSFNTRENTELYVFSTSAEGQLLLDSVKSGSMKVRRINEDRSLAHSLISNHPITENCTIKDGEKIISALIIGFGGYGRELTKALLWCGQLPDYSLELNVIDKSPDAEAYFRAECPEIMTLNNNKELGEARYSLNFYNGLDVCTYKFNETVSALLNTSVVYISLGNDELNIETAIRTRILFERCGLYPTIRAVVYSDIKGHMLSKHELLNFNGKSYDIEIIGNANERFSYDTIINEELERRALECHLKWSNTPEDIEKATIQFNEYEYFRNSSIATAIHEDYRKAANLPEDIAAIAEHMRWNAYMRTEGFVYSGSPDKASRNDRAKMHHNLHRAALLNEDDADKDRRVISSN